LAALSASSYSYVSMVQRFGPLMNEGGAAISLTYIASERIIPGWLTSTVYDTTTVYDSIAARENCTEIVHGPCGWALSLAFIYNPELKRL